MSLTIFFFRYTYEFTIFYGIFDDLFISNFLSFRIKDRLRWRPKRARSPWIFFFKVIIYLIFVVGSLSKTLGSLSPQ